MSEEEKLLVWLLERLTDHNMRGVMLTAFIQENGPLSEAAGEKVRAMLSG